MGLILTLILLFVSHIVTNGLLCACCYGNCYTFLQLYLRKVRTGDCDSFIFTIRRTQFGSILGSNFMSGYTVIFDREKMRVGFALSSCDLPDNRHDLPRISNPEPKGDYIM